ncbi:hypothetical protein RDWZM_003528 [Blomia tropicalis]|uniref:Uncharacterized protein n=1 Tax=Blomia tropicalis TaxID=40697 RepID=A0A9Q0MH31_BLOTA|nr:hypothetical protein RDWZM_003528 [Blomia tropicalis]
MMMRFRTISVKDSLLPHGSEDRIKQNGELFAFTHYTFSRCRRPRFIDCP